MSDEKTQVNDIDRSLYDFRYEEKEGEFFRKKGEKRKKSTLSCQTFFHT